jgi:hypothetical protein
MKLRPTNGVIRFAVQVALVAVLLFTMYFPGNRIIWSEILNAAIVLSPFIFAYAIWLEWRRPRPRSETRADRIPLIVLLSLLIVLGVPNSFDSLRNSMHWRDWQGADRPPPTAPAIGFCRDGKLNGLPCPIPTTTVKHELDAQKPAR